MSKMQLGFTLLYTRDVGAKLAFYEKAFGVERQYVSKDGEYGQLAGAVPLGFVREDLARKTIDFVSASRGGKPAAVEIGFVTEDVAKAYQRALDAGCTAVAAPAEKPWGQTVSLVRDDDGVLVEIATPWSV